MAGAGYDISASLSSSSAAKSGNYGGFSATGGGVQFGNASMPWQNILLWVSGGIALLILASFLFRRKGGR